MKKQILALFMGCVLLCGFSGCGKTSKATENKTTTTTVSNENLNKDKDDTDYKDIDIKQSEKSDYYTPIEIKNGYDSLQTDDQRKFYDLEETHGNIDIFIEDTFKAKERDILDIRHRNSDFGENGFYIVLDGKLEKICAAGDLQNISTIKRFLKGEIIFENFLEIVGLKEIEVGVIDELFED